MGTADRSHSETPRYNLHVKLEYDTMVAIVDRRRMQDGGQSRSRQSLITQQYAKALAAWQEQFGWLHPSALKTVVEVHASCTINSTCMLTCIRDAG